MFKLDFNFLKENKILKSIKEKIVVILKNDFCELKQDLKDVVNNYIINKTPEAKKIIVDLIINKVEWKFPLNLFKKRIKTVLEKNFDKLVDFILAKLQEV